MTAALAEAAGAETRREVQQAELEELHVPGGQNQSRSETIPGAEPLEIITRYIPTDETLRKCSQTLRRLFD